MTHSGSEDFDPVGHVLLYHEAINALDFAAIEAMFAEEAVYASGGVGGNIEGRAAIMAAFRKYFDVYPDQVADDDLVEAVGAFSARSVWRLVATYKETGDRLMRSGQETVTFDAVGKIMRVDVRDE